MSTAIKEITFLKGTLSHRYHHQPSSSWSSIGDQEVSSGYRLKSRGAFVSSNGVIPTNYFHCKWQCGSSFSDYSKSIYASHELGDVYTVGSQTGPNINGLWSGFSFSGLHGAFNVGASKGVSPLSIPTLEKARCFNKLLKRIDDQSINIGAIVAELGETVAYGASIGLSLARFGTSILTGNFSSAVKTFGITKRRWRRFHRSSLYKASTSVTEQVAKRWVEYSFAIYPTLKDIRDLTALYSSPEKVLGRVKVRASAIQNVYRNDASPASINGWEHNVTSILTGNVYSRVTYSINDPEIISRKALGLNNLKSAALEAVPFSWLVDYVINLGEFVSLLSAVDGLTFKHGYVSAKLNQSDQLKSEFITAGPKKSYRNITHIANGLWEGYKREKMISFPRPTLRVVLPELTLRKASLALSVGYLLKRNAVTVAAY